MGSSAPPADPFQTEVARIALAAAKQHGFALGGGHALIAHGIVRRSTEDVDLFTDSDDGVRAATQPVADALGNADLYGVAAKAVRAAFVDWPRPV